jgi:hypothetical protein
VHNGIEEMATFDYASGTDNGFFRINRHVNAFTNDYFLLGSPSFRWKTIYSVNALSTSSSTYKDNIKYLDGMKDEARAISSEETSSITTKDMLDFVKDIPLASFDYKGRFKHGENHSLGFIAEDIQDTKIGKEFIFDSDKGAMFNPTSYTSIVVGAAKELITEIEVLKNTINELKKEIEELKK